MTDKKIEGYKPKRSITAEKVGVWTGASTFGSLGFFAGAKVGIAALGTAVSGVFVLPIVGVIVGALSGYTIVKMFKDRKSNDN